MLFSLALALGKTVAELSRPGVLSNAEFMAWCEYYQQEPFGEQRADLRAGVIASTMANIYTAHVGAKTVYRPLDFMPYAQGLDQAPPVETECTLTDDELEAWADAAIYGISPG